MKIRYNLGLILLLDELSQHHAQFTGGISYMMEMPRALWHR